MRILFVLGRYLPKPSANGICVTRVQKSLFRLGVESDVVVDKYDDTVRSSPFGKVYPAAITDPKSSSKSLMRKLKAVLLYPVFYPQDVGSYIEAIQKALAENEYDAIVSVLKPGNGALAAKNYSNFLIYELDSLANNIDNERGYKRYLTHRVRFVEKLLYKKATYIFHMLSHKHFYDRNVYRRYSEKSEYLDIPQLLDEQIEDQTDKSHKVIRILYSGILQREMRSPVYPVRLFTELMKLGAEPMEINFYSRGDCEDFLAQAEKETNELIRQRGYVSLKELNEAVGKTDFLLSIGNNMPGVVTSLPSKVISYMAYGKPIIHIDAGKNDVAKDYLKQYPLTLIIDPNCDLVDNATKLKRFMEEHLDSRIPFDEVKQKFPLNTPEYTAKRMIEIIRTRCNGKVHTNKK